MNVSFLSHEGASSGGGPGVPLGEKERQPEEGGPRGPSALLWGQKRARAPPHERGGCVWF